MTASQLRSKKPLEVTIAYAANRHGDGVAYAAVAGDEQPLRVTFEVERRPALQDREVGYAALLAIAGVLASRRARNVRMSIPDERVVLDLAERRPLPLALALLYVQLKCCLNTFARAEVLAGPRLDDLENRARAEVELAAAA